MAGMKSRALLLALLLVPTTVVGGCTKKYAAQTAEPALGGDAEIAIKKNKTQTYDIDIGVENLPPAARLGKYAGYGVWVVAGETAPVKLGMLAYDEDKRTGDLTATTPFRTFELRVTLEPDAAATSPSNVVVVKQSVKAGK